MAYKKPQIIAKSEAKQTYLAGCPTYRSMGCGATDYRCFDHGTF